MIKAFASLEFILVMPFVISRIPIKSGSFIFNIDVRALKVTMAPSTPKRTFTALLILSVRENFILFLELSKKLQGIFLLMKPTIKLHNKLVKIKKILLFKLRNGVIVNIKFGL